MSSKWGTQYWTALGERVGATFIGALITMLTADQSGVLLGTPAQWWIIVGLPTVLAALKGLAANLGGGGPSAINAEQVVAANPGEGGHVDVVTVLLVVLVVVVLLVLLGVV